MNMKCSDTHTGAVMTQVAEDASLAGCGAVDAARRAKFGAFMRKACSIMASLRVPSSCAKTMVRWGLGISEYIKKTKKTLSSS